MPRETSPYIFGDFWLDKRRDGRSADIWQIARYDEETRSVIYRSTKRRTVDLESAKAVLRAFEANERSRRSGQQAAEAELLPHLFNYLREHGPDVGRLDTMKSSFRAWIGFFMQDELGTGVKVADLNKVSVTRFRRWRLGPHEWEIEWGGKTYPHTSRGVSGEAVQRNIEDLRAALHHAQDAGRIVAPKIPSVDKSLRSKPADTLATFEQLGAILGYARALAALPGADQGPAREIALMLATAARPGASMAFQPKYQWQDDIIDLQPVDRLENDKRNAEVPTIPPLRPILEAWQNSPHQRVRSRKRWWRTARRVLNLAPEIEAFTIRHTLSTYLDEEGVPGAQISAIAGHLPTRPSRRGMARTTAKHYIHYKPRAAMKALRALTKFFNAVDKAATQWAADHTLTTPARNKPLQAIRNRVTP